MLEISKKISAKIVKNMKEIIGQDVNFMDLNGVIIASTDKSRIGTFHEAAKKCIDEKREIIINNNNEYIGAKKGINIPVSSEQNVVGVIGITGDRKKVEKYGYIIKQMTEILIKESILKNMKTAEHRYLIESIINKNYDNVSLPFEKFKIVLSSISSQDIFDNIPKKYIYTVMYNKVVYLIDSKDNLDFFNENNIYAIISDDISSCEEFESSFEKMKSIFDYMLNYISDPKVLILSDIDIEYILSDTCNTSVKNYLYTIFKNLTINEILEFKKTFEIYKKNNGSINACSKELFFHKNTIQYKLNQIKIKTGYDPRVLKDFTKLDIAFSFIKKH